MSKSETENSYIKGVSEDSKSINQSNKTINGVSNGLFSSNFACLDNLSHLRISINR